MQQYCYCKNTKMNSFLTLQDLKNTLHKRCKDVIQTFNKDHFYLFRAAFGIKQVTLHMPKLLQIIRMDLEPVTFKSDLLNQLE